MRRRRKRREALSETPATTAVPEVAQPAPAPPSAVRIIVVGQIGPMREALEAAVDAQPDMELVGSFDDMDSGTSGIRANTRRSGVVVLVDVGTLEAAGAMTEIRRLRDRFPFCRFLAYGEGFDEDAASALLFFGADAVIGVSEGEAAVARAIRRGARPGEDQEEEVEAEPEGLEDGPEAAPEPEPTDPPLQEVEAEEEPQPQPELEPDSQDEPGHELDQPQPPEDSPPGPGPATSPFDEDRAEGPPAPRPDQGSAEEIWRGAPPTGVRPPSRRMTPNDIWKSRASDARFETPSAIEPANGEQTGPPGRSVKALSSAGGRIARTLRRPFRADKRSDDQPDETTSGQDPPGEAPPSDSLTHDP